MIQNLKRVQLSEDSQNLNYTGLFTMRPVLFWSAGEPPRPHWVSAGSGADLRPDPSVLSARGPENGSKVMSETSPGSCRTLETVQPSGGPVVSYRSPDPVSPIRFSRDFLHLDHSNQVRPEGGSAEALEPALQKVLKDILEMAPQSSLRQILNVPDRF